jgi:hypothetical protein
MRKVLVALLVVAICCAITSSVSCANGDTRLEGCSNYNSNKEAVNQLPQSLYGKWKITKLLGHSAIFTNEVDDEKMIGKEIEYYAEKVIWGNTVIENPVYHITTMPILEFERGNRVNGKKLGIESETIKHVMVDSLTTRADIGVYIKDSDTLIYPIGGSWFEMRRAE